MQQSKANETPIDSINALRISNWETDVAITESKH